MENLEIQTNETVTIPELVLCIMCEGDHGNNSMCMYLYEPDFYWE